MNSKEENSPDFCPNYVQEFGLCTVNDIPSVRSLMILSKCSSRFPTILPSSFPVTSGTASGGNMRGEIIHREDVV